MVEMPLGASRSKVHFKVQDSNLIQKYDNFLPGGLNIFRQSLETQREYKTDKSLKNMYSVHAQVVTCFFNMFKIAIPFK